MFNLFHKKKKDKVKKEEPEKEAQWDHPQDDKYGIVMGMYCEACGYMEVNEDSSALPLEGFAICPNCGAYLKRASFIKRDDGGYVLAENAVKVKNVRKSGGHYRVRKAGPNIIRSKGNGRIAKIHCI